MTELQRAQEIVIQPAAAMREPTFEDVSRWRTGPHVSTPVTRLLPAVRDAVIGDRKTAGPSGTYLGRALTVRSARSTARARSARVVTSILWKMLRKCVSTVF